MEGKTNREGNVFVEIFCANYRATSPSGNYFVNPGVLGRRKSAPSRKIIKTKLQALQAADFLPFLSFRSIVIVEIDREEILEIREEKRRRVRRTRSYAFPWLKENRKKEKQENRKESSNVETISGRSSIFYYPINQSKRNVLNSIYLHRKQTRFYEVGKPRNKSIDARTHMYGRLRIIKRTHS